MDIPAAQLSVEERIEHLNKVIKKEHDCKLIPWRKCLGLKDLKEFSVAVAEKYNVYNPTCTAPGKNRLAKTVWMMKPDSCYTYGKSLDLLKTSVDIL